MKVHPMMDDEVGRRGAFSTDTIAGERTLSLDGPVWTVVSVACPALPKGGDVLATEPRFVMVTIEEYTAGFASSECRR